MRRWLIMVSGASPGAGKSTLAAVLARRFSARGIASHALSEGELLTLPLFARFDREVGNNDARAIATFAEGVRALAADAAASDSTWITDALLPGFFWLLGRYPFGRVEACSDDIARILHPLRPLVVYLDGDIAHLFGRATAERGAAWGERMVAAIQRWELPYYPDTPPRDLDDVIRFFGWLKRQTLALLARWPEGALILDAARAPTDSPADCVLDHLDKEMFDEDAQPRAPQ